MRTLNEILEAHSGTTALISYNSFKPEGKKWWGQLECKVDGIELKIYIENQEYPEHVIDALVGKWRRVTKGLPEFSGPLLETTAQRLDDEIPF